MLETRADATKDLYSGWMSSNKEEYVKSHQSQAHVDENPAMDTASKFPVYFVTIIDVE